MCHHENVLDDVRSGDRVCADCGLVLDVVLGGYPGREGGGQIWRKRGGRREESPPPPPPPPPRTVTSRRLRRRRRRLQHYTPPPPPPSARDEIRGYLDQFNLDNEFVLQRVLHNYEKIYGNRTVKPGFRKTEYKHRTALAFSLCNVLSREKMPRPIQYIVELFGLDTSRALLDIPRALNFGAEEHRALPLRQYELQDSYPQDYIDVLCAHLRLPFKIATAAREKSEEVRWKFYGHHPTVIAGAALQEVLASTPHSSELDREICLGLGCQQKAVSLLRKQFV